MRTKYTHLYACVSNFTKSRC